MSMLNSKTIINCSNKYYENSYKKKKRRRRRNKKFEFDVDEIEHSGMVDGRIFKSRSNESK